VLRLLALRIASTSGVKPVGSFFDPLFLSEGRLDLREVIDVALLLEILVASPCTAVVSKLLAPVLRRKKKYLRADVINNTYTLCCCVISKISGR
jgi:hypothetical protein